MMGKVAVITGASSGIGRASARAFATAGYRLGLIARSDEGLLAAAHEVQEMGSEALIVTGDVAEPADVERLASETEADWIPVCLPYADEWTELLVPSSSTGLVF